MREKNQKYQTESFMKLETEAMFTQMSSKAIIKKFG